MQARLIKYWYQPTINLIMWPLMPFSWLFGICVAIRRSLFRFGILKQHHFGVPVIVVGNVNVGGTGKTPFVIWLANFLRAQGFSPGIVSRGVGGEKHGTPHLVKVNDLAKKVGDEALILFNQSDCPVVICANRPYAVRYLLEQTHCNIVLSDDGLQHYSLARQIEIALIDGQRGLGNHHLLPAGPLREPAKRLKSVDFVIVKDGSAEQLSMRLEPQELFSLTCTRKVSLKDFPYQKVHAVTGIGHPEKFFNELKKAGLILIEHVFPDHYAYKPGDLDFEDNLPILMTEKDAVKCYAFANERCWYLPVTASVDERFKVMLMQKLESVIPRRRESISNLAE